MHMAKLSKCAMNNMGVKPLFSYLWNLPEDIGLTLHTEWLDMIPNINDGIKGEMYKLHIL